MHFPKTPFTLYQIYVGDVSIFSCALTFPLLKMFPYDDLFQVQVIT